MLKRNLVIRLLVGSVFVTIFFFTWSVFEVNAVGNPTPTLQEGDTEEPAGLFLTEHDLPGFLDVEEMAIAGPLDLAKRLTSSFFDDSYTITNVAAFRSDDPFRAEFVFNFMAYPLSEAEETRFDDLASQPRAIVETLTSLAASSGNLAEPHLMDEVDGIGDRSMGFSLSLGQDPVAQNIDFVWVRRGEIIQGTWIVYPVGEIRPIDLRQIAAIVDQRVQEHFTGTIFRPSSVLVPEITTHVPTPLDVSTNPTVIGTNLLLAALVMLPFAAAVEQFTRMVGDNEQNFLRKFRLTAWFSRGRQRQETKSTRKATNRTIGIVRALIIMLFYGVTFSLLDPAWQPFTITGLLLLLSMTLAYGIVGLAGDFIQWMALRRWGTQAELSLRPTNILLAVGSTLASRLFKLVPGMMFGTPEALVVDETLLNDQKRNRLIRISAITLLAIGFGLWAMTTITDLVQRGMTVEGTTNIIGGFEAFLLIIFAVTLENAFVSMLGFPGSFGENIRKNSFILWLIGMIGITFVFIHTLINPRGDLAQAIQEANILLFLGVAGAFTLITLIWGFASRRKQEKVRTLADEEKQQESKQATPAWVWVATLVMVLMVAGTLWIDYLMELPIIVSAIDTITENTLPTGSPDTGDDEEIYVEFDVPEGMGTLCYVPTKDISTNILDTAIWRGIQLAASHFGWEAVPSYPVTLDADGYTQAIEEFYYHGCDLIIGHASLEETFLDGAAAFPDQLLLLLGSSESGNETPNLWIVEYELDQGSYLAGYLAAEVSNSGHLGVFGGNTLLTNSSLECFVEGTAAYGQANQASISVHGWNSRVRQGLSADDLASQELGHRLSDQLIEQGADVILPLAGVGPGSTSYGAGESVASEAGIALIGMYLDWRWAAPELADVVITSVETRFDQSIAIAIQALSDGNIREWRHTGSLASGEIRLSPLHARSDLVSPNLKVELGQLAASPGPICDPAPPPSTGSSPTSTAIPSSTPTASPTPVAGEKINMFGLQASGISQIEFPAGQPFFIQHGFCYPVDEVPADPQAFFLETDGVSTELTSLISQPSDGEICYFSRYEFAEGMTGTHIFTGIWTRPEIVRETLTIIFVP